MNKQPDVLRGAAWAIVLGTGLGMALEHFDLTRDAVFETLEDTAYQFDQHSGEIPEDLTTEE